MKASELRIKNLVEFEGKIYEIHTIADEFPTLNTAEFGIGVVDWNNIKPIPLTEEWLLKFGFVKEFSGCYVFNDYVIFQNTNNIVVGMCKNGFYQSTGQRFVVELKFVHQLQNLYFALTKTELKLK